MIDSTQVAIDTLHDTKKSEFEREVAINYLVENVSAERAQALVVALEDDDEGVQWKAASALGRLGEEALPSLLRALARPDNDARLRKGALHALHTMKPELREETKELQKALSGPAADIATMEAAYELMARRHIS
jgi:HEAT repeat protein